MGSLFFWKDLVSMKYPRVLYIRGTVAIAGPMGWGTMLSGCIKKHRSSQPFVLPQGMPAMGNDSMEFDSRRIV